MEYGPRGAAGPPVVIRPPNRVAQHLIRARQDPEPRGCRWVAGSGIGVRGASLLAVGVNDGLLGSPRRYTEHPVQAPRRAAWNFVQALHMPRSLAEIYRRVVKKPPVCYRDRE
jgi:hypothetical protein